jgi:hypothetical protein
MIAIRLQIHVNKVFILIFAKQTQTYNRLKSDLSANYDHRILVHLLLIPFHVLIMTVRIEYYYSSRELHLLHYDVLE